MQQGDRVRCVNVDILNESGIKPVLALDAEYTIKDTYECGCKQLHLDVGASVTANYVTCYKCGETLPKQGRIHWCNSIRFTL